jgi:hypothetical protein
MTTGAAVEAATRTTTSSRATRWSKPKFSLTQLRSRDRPTPVRAVEAEVYIDRSGRRVPLVQYQIGGKRSLPCTRLSLPLSSPSADHVRACCRQLRDRAQKFKFDDASENETVVWAANKGKCAPVPLLSLDTRDASEQRERETPDETKGGKRERERGGRDTCQEG